MLEAYHTRVATAELCPLKAALNVVDERAELNHRYRKLIDDSRPLLESSDIRLTQARGIAKKLMVLVKASGPKFRGALTARDRDAIDAGLVQADELVYGSHD